MSEGQVVIGNNLESQHFVKEASRLFTNLEFFLSSITISLWFILTDGDLVSAVGALGKIVSWKCSGNHQSGQRNVGA